MKNINNYSITVYFFTFSFSKKESYSPCKTLSQIYGKTKLRTNKGSVIKF